MDRALQRAVLAWGRAHRRDLPWRHTRDPWAVLVSEVMLQQTQVARVVPRYHDFLRRFPSVGSCAAATAGEVVREWSGLGYNRRAVRLHGSAVAVAASPTGRFPTECGELQRLPGIGPYTARALMAFAYEADAAVVDTNVARTMARWCGRPLRPAEVQRQADGALAPGQGWVWNQSMLDLGAIVCTARQPDCAACPLAPSCRWLAAGRPAPDPAVGSAHVAGGQAPFAGSDRQGRGRLVRALAGGPVSSGHLPSVMGWPDDARRAERVAAGVVVDGLAVRDALGTFHLP